MRFSVQSWSSLLIVAAGLQGGTGVALGRCEAAKLVRRPEVKAALRATGTDVVVRGSREFAALLRVEFDK